MYRLRIQLYPETPFAKQKIADQALPLLHRKIFTELELDDMVHVLRDHKEKLNELLV